MKSIYLGLIISLLSITIQAQEDNFEWAKSMGGTGTDYGYSITTDNFGNIYATGMFEGTVDFDPSEATYNLTSKGMFDIFIQKLDSDGNFIWAKSMGGPIGESGQSINTDPDGNIYVTGDFEDTVDFNPGIDIFNLISNGAGDIFILKLDSTGNFIWAKSIGGSYWDYGLSVAIDASNNLCLTGGFSTTVDFDPGEEIVNLTSNGLTDFFVMKLDDSGNLLWVESMGGIYGEQGRTILTDADENIYLTGFFKATVDFDPGESTYNITSHGGWDCFIQKLNSNGDFLWAKSMGGFSDDYGHCLSKDAADNLYITGFFEGSVDFDPGIGNYILSSNGSRDIYIQKLNSDGEFIWAKSLGGTSNDHAYSISSDSYGNVYITGAFRGIVDFDPSAEIYNLSSNGWDDIYIMMLDSDGDFVWAKSMGESSNDLGYSVTTGSPGYIYVTGNFAETVDFDPSASTLNLTSNGSLDIFVMKFGPVASSLEEKILLTHISIYPNPNHGQISIDLGDLLDVSIKIFSTDGHLIYYKENINASIHHFEFNEAPGVYFIEVSTENRKQQLKLIKQ